MILASGVEIDAAPKYPEASLWQVRGGMAKA